MNVTYQSGKVNGTLHAAATQLMSLSTSAYATQIILDDCITAKKCNFECPHVDAFARPVSSKNKGMINYAFPNMSPAVTLMSLKLADTIAFPFTPHE